MGRLLVFNVSQQQSQQLIWVASFLGLARLADKMILHEKQTGRGMRAESRIMAELVLALRLKIGIDFFQN